MPKQLLELRLFNAGTVTSVDASDIPAEASSFSLNIDSQASGGVLQGVPRDLQMAFLSTESHVIWPTDGGMDFITVDGQNRYIVYDGGWKVAYYTSVSA
jgi:hypothetical protein